MRIKSNNKGFTLIEMLIVVVIIGVLAAIILPRMTGSSQTAKINACKANVAALNQAFELLAFEKSYNSTELDGNFPSTGNATQAFTADWGDNTNKVSVADMKQYFPDGSVACPVNTGDAVKYVIADGRVDVNNGSASHTH